MVSALANNLNVPAPGISYFTPAQSPAAGTAVDTANPEDGEKTLPKLFRPIRIRGVEFQNRIWVSPMGQYSGDNGKVTSWHLAHLGGILSRGPGLTMTESTAISLEGRITPEDAGIWSDEHIDAWKRITEFAHSQNQKIGIQLNHSGRKGSSVAPWITGNATASKEVGGFPDNVWAPSAVRFRDDFPLPNELTKEGIEKVKQDFVEAAKRSVKAGFDVIELHNAHGFLLHNFVSPVSNKRTDEYGGSFENRIRFTLEVVDAVRAAIPDTMPLFVRVSATDWLTEVFPDQPSWTPEDTARLAPILYEHGVDFLDVSSGGIHPAQKIIGGPAYQAPFAQKVMERINVASPALNGNGHVNGHTNGNGHANGHVNGDTSRPRLLVGSVGVFTEADVAEDVLQKGWADVILVGRQFLKDPSLVWTWADRLGVVTKHAAQIGWTVRGRARK